MQITHSEPSAALLAGVLENLLNYLLRDCGHSAHRAGLLLARLAEDPDADGGLRQTCQRLSEHLEGF